MKWEEQVLGIYAASKGAVDDFKVSDVRRFEKELIQFIKQKYGSILETFRREKKISDEIKAQLDKSIEEF